MSNKWSYLYRRIRRNAVIVQLIGAARRGVGGKKDPLNSFSNQASPCSLRSNHTPSLSLIQFAQLNLLKENYIRKNRGKDRPKTDYFAYKWPLASTHYEWQKWANSRPLSLLKEEPKLKLLSRPLRVKRSFGWILQIKRFFSSLHTCIRSSCVQLLRWIFLPF